MNPGDLYWVEIPSRGGHAQAGRRPALIMQTAQASAVLSTVLLIPLTTQIDALRFPGTLLIEPSRENGLHRNSVALIFQMSAVDKRYIEAFLGHLAQPTLEEIWQVLDEIIKPLT